MLFLFVACALVPLAALAIIGFIQVSGQLNEQSLRRLKQASKTMGQAIVERLTLVDAEMTMLSSSLKIGSTAKWDAGADSFGEIKQHFKGIAYFSNSGDCTPLFGRVENSPKVNEEEQRHLRSRKTLLFTRKVGDQQAAVYMMRAVNPADLTQGILVGRINVMYLMGLLENDTLPAMTEICVLDASNEVVYSSLLPPSSFFEKASSLLRNSARGDFEWRHGGREYLASYSCPFLKYHFLTPNWTVVMSQSRDDVFTPMANFKRIFPMVILMSFWVVSLLSIVQIRRSLVPLENLKEGTRRITLRDFESRVPITSNDEFGELAESFNAMSRRLGTQFNALATVADIDRAILAELDSERIVNTVLAGMCRLFSCDLVGVAVLEESGKGRMPLYFGSSKPDVVKLVEMIEIMPEEEERLSQLREEFIPGLQGSPPNYLVPFAKRGFKSFLILPVNIKQRLAGVIILAFITTPAMDRDDLDQARQVAEQVAVALSNAGLVNELDQLNTGILTSLARAVDTKSAWTGGHSERVTQLGMRIGEAIGLGQDELISLHRGGLLHDVGKIGIPAEILDKPGKLTDEEFEIIRQHPRMGVRILEPIKNYRDVMSNVLHHHERFDGKGYPDRISGNQISLGARILAVADVWDAIISDRPYRAGMEFTKALSIIREGSGTQFDPDVVEVFLSIIETERMEAGGGLSGPGHSIANASRQSHG